MSYAQNERRLAAAETAHAVRVLAERRRNTIRREKQDTALTGDGANAENSYGVFILGHSKLGGEDVLGGA